MLRQLDAPGSPGMVATTGTFSAGTGSMRWISDLRTSTGFVGCKTATFVSPAGSAGLAVAAISAALLATDSVTFTVAGGSTSLAAVGSSAVFAGPSAAFAAAAAVAAAMLGSTAGVPAPGFGATNDADFWGASGFSNAG